jgi:hypothetical protein
MSERALFFVRMLVQNLCCKLVHCTLQSTFSTLAVHNCRTADPTVLEKNSNRLRCCDSVPVGSLLLRSINLDLQLRSIKFLFLNSGP